MPSKIDRTGVWLDDILENIEFAESFVDGLAFDAFKTDTMRLYATVRCFEIMSEASRRLPDALKARHPLIDWAALAAAGNVFGHEYGVVSAERLWRFLSDHVPALRAAVTQELAALDTPH